MLEEDGMREIKDNDDKTQEERDLEGLHNICEKCVKDREIGGKK